MTIKEDHMNVHRKKAQALVRSGEMSLDDYLTKVCGVSPSRVPALRDIALLQIGLPKC